MSDFTPGKRLWLTADRTTVVEDGDPNAAFLLTAGPDDTIPEEQAKELGLVNNKAESKQAEPAEDKQAEEPENKASGLTVSRRKGKTE